MNSARETFIVSECNLWHGFMKYEDAPVLTFWDHVRSVQIFFAVCLLVFFLSSLRVSFLNLRRNSPFQNWLPPSDRVRPNPLLQHTLRNIMPEDAVAEMSGEHPDRCCGWGLVAGFGRGFGYLGSVTDWSPETLRFFFLFICLRQLPSDSWTNVEDSVCNTSGWLLNVFHHRYLAKYYSARRGATRQCFCFLKQ